MRGDTFESCRSDHFFARVFENIKEKAGMWKIVRNGSFPFALVLTAPDSTKKSTGQHRSS